VRLVKSCQSGNLSNSRSFLVRYTIKIKIFKINGHFKFKIIQPFAKTTKFEKKIDRYSLNFKKPLNFF